MDKYLEKIEKKLNDNPELRTEIRAMHDKLEEIFETPIEITLVDNTLINDYENRYSMFVDTSIDDDTFTVREFIEYISEELDSNMKVAIDPCYLHEGINEINNLLLTTYDDNVIIVPQAKRNK